MKIKVSEIKPGEFFQDDFGNIFMRFRPKPNERVTGLGTTVDSVWVTPALGGPQQTCSFSIDPDYEVERLVAKFSSGSK